MRRHPGLAPLSRDHLQALIAGRSLRDLPVEVGEGDRRVALTTFLDFWRDEGAAHFREEEERLLPWFARFASLDRPEIARMLLEHADIRGRVMAAQDVLLRGGAPATGDLRDLGRLFMAHVRLEEDVIFPMIEAAVPAEAWGALGDL